MLMKNVYIKKNIHFIKQKLRGTVSRLKVLRSRTIHPPHNYLRQRLGWYDSWHSHRHHKKAHWGILAFYLVAVIATLGAVRMAYAADFNDIWDFSSPSDYTVSDPNLVEVVGSQARLKALNYTSDAQTSALYHFDENTGTTAGDSSPHGNTASFVGTPSWVTGNLDKALQFDGNGQSLSVADSTSLSMTGQQSLEAWIKPDAIFNNSATQSQSILDKGSYRLGLDHTNGKLTYEIQNNNSEQWTKRLGDGQSGSWDFNHNTTESITSSGSDIYIGTGISRGDAEVWKWNGSTWQMIGGDGIRSSWLDQTYENVASLAIFGTNLYAGLGNNNTDGEIWTCNITTDCTSWTKVAGDGIGIPASLAVTSLAVHNGSLFAGTTGSAGAADVYRYNGGTSWSQIGGDGVNSGWVGSAYETVASMYGDGTYLYVGLGSTAGDAEIWRWNGTSWSQIGGDGVNTSWSGTEYETVRSLTSMNGRLYAGLGDGGDDADVYMMNGSSWSKIGGDGLNGSWSGSAFNQVQSLTSDGTYIYASHNGTVTGNSVNTSVVRRWDGASWTILGGGTSGSGSWGFASNTKAVHWVNNTLYALVSDATGGTVYALNSAVWTQIGGSYINNSWSPSTIGTVQGSTQMNGKAYFALGGGAGGAYVYEYDGNSARRIGGAGLSGSWQGQQYTRVFSTIAYKGNLYVSLGANTNTAEVWRWDGSLWTKIAGSGVASTWSNINNALSMTVWQDNLYVGLGNSPGWAQIWQYNGSAWTNVTGSWGSSPRSVESLVEYRGRLCAGMGGNGTWGEVWCRSSGGTWEKIGGGNGVSVNGSWASSNRIKELVVYKDKLYASVVSTVDSLSMWEWNGASWSQVGGSNLAGSWADGTYTETSSSAVYNGELYIGTGAATSTGDVWRYNGSSWVKVGGGGLNSGWAFSASVEEVSSLMVYKGKLYAGLGNSASLDALVYSFGNNAYVESTTTSFSAAWQHVAATYDGINMKLFINGIEDVVSPVAATGVDNDMPLLIGANYGSSQAGSTQSFFKGSIDEVRLSSSARTSFTSKPYAATPQTVGLGSAVRTAGVLEWLGFAASETPNGGTLTYRMSDDGGTSWKYWTGSAWATSASLLQANTKADVDSHISSFPVTFNGIKWQAVLSGDGSQQVTLNNVEITSDSDSDDPNANASAVTAKKSQAGAALSSNAWTNGASPYFSWTAGTDTGSGIAGYCLYLGTDNTANPVTTKGLLGTSPVNTGGHCQFMVSGTDIDLATSGYLASPLVTSNSPYYLSIRAVDHAGNVFDTSAQFQFRFDNTPPTNPGYVTSPSSFINTKTATLTWPTSGGSAAQDANSGLAGLQYRVNNSTWYGDAHSGAQDASDLLSNDGSYTTVDPPDFGNLTEGSNTINFRTYDQAGNVTTSYVNAELKINTSGAPTQPENLTALPTSNSNNAFAFDWDAPNSHVGSPSSLVYCYTINAVPTSSNCSYTAAGVTELPEGPYATQPGTNTVYVVARDESSNINYATYASTTFQANTVAPGLPTSVDIVDVSVKTTSNWRLALTWDPPASVGSGVASYKIFRSLNNSTFNLVGTSGSTTYIDAGLSQQPYYYRIQACDSTNNCGANSAVVSKTPTGKFTEPASLVSEPAVSNISTRKATVSWVTNRESDSRIAIGTKSGEYASSEIANSDQATIHTLDLANLQAGTTYYYVAKWTDADGNIGTSSEYSFATAPAPVVKEVVTSQVGLSNATIQFTTKSSVQAKIYYGQTDSFGGVKVVNTALGESSYSVQLPDLLDGTKYYYKISTLDSEGNEYDGNTYSFTTPQRPKISNLALQPVEGEPTSTQRVSWITNVPTTSQVSYGKVGGDTKEIIASDLVTEHEITIRGLEDSSQYSLVARSRDTSGNEAVSDVQVFKTELDTRPPKVSELVVESTIRGTGSEARGQIIVSWKTDEPATSQVAFGEGSDVINVRSQTAEDASLTTEHLVIISDLSTAKPYTVQALSRDRGGNQAKSETQTALIGRASDSILSIIFNTLQRMFGFIGK